MKNLVTDKETGHGSVVSIKVSSDISLGCSLSYPVAGVEDQILP